MAAMFFENTSRTRVSYFPNWAALSKRIVPIPFCLYPGSTTMVSIYSSISEETACFWNMAFICLLMMAPLKRPKNF